MSTREPESIRRAAPGEPGRADRAGAGGRCGHGHQLRVLPGDGHRGRRHRAGGAPRRTGAAGRGHGVGARHGQHRHRRERATRVADVEPFDAVVCSLVLCSVQDPDGVLRQLFSMLRPGGELRYLEHVASTGMRATAATPCRRHGVAAAVRQLPHPPRHRAVHHRCRLRGGRRPPRVGAASVGAAAGHPRPRSGGPSGRPDRRLSPAVRAVAASGWAAPWPRIRATRSTRGPTAVWARG